MSNGTRGQWVVLVGRLRLCSTLFSMHSSSVSTSRPSFYRAWRATRWATRWVIGKEDSSTTLAGSQASQ